MNYLIIQEFGSTSPNAAAQLQCAVAEAIGAGWAPCGGISITRLDDGFLFAQAMVKN